MKQFIDDIIAYISADINGSGLFTQTFVVDREYRYKKLVTPRIGVLQLDNNDISRYDSFDGELVSSIPLQINVYVTNMLVGGYNKTAQEAAEMVADRITNLFDKVTITLWNKNILGIRRSGCPAPQPLKENGAIYVAMLRYEMQVYRNYETI